MPPNMAKDGARLPLLRFLWSIHQGNMPSSTFGEGINTEATGGVAELGEENSCAGLEPSETKYLGANLRLFFGITLSGDGLGGGEVGASGIRGRGTEGCL